jgi:hypothetical protein
MALTFNRSSSNQFPDIVAASKIGGNAVSALAVIKTSTAPIDDWSCDPAFGPACSWGDYAGATPDPAAATTAAHGTVWFSNAFAEPSAQQTQADWRTWNFAVNP